MPEIEMIAASRVEELLVARGGQPFTSSTGARAYIMPNGQTVRIPAGNARYPEVVVREIATIKLEMSDWEYDYWLTEQDSPGFVTFKMPAPLADEAMKISAQKHIERAAGPLDALFLDKGKDQAEA